MSEMIDSVCNQSIEVVRAWAPIIAASIGALVAIGFGLHQARIANMQAQTAKDKLRLDLYEKRIAVYEEINKFISIAVVNGDTTAADEFNFWKGIAPAQWLFSKEVDIYLTKELWPLMADFHAINADLRGNPYDEQRAPLAKKRSELFMDISEQRKKIDELMSPYLHFPLKN